MSELLAVEPEPTYRLVTNYEMTPERARALIRLAIPQLKAFVKQELDEIKAAREAMEANREA